LIKQDIYVEVQLEQIKNVDFDSEEAIYEFVKEILPGKLQAWKAANLKQAAVILIKHEFNQENLQIEDAYKVRDTKILRLEEGIKSLEKEVEALEALDMQKKEIYRRRALITEINALRREQHKLIHWFFEKEREFNSYVLHKEKKEWSSFLFGTRKFLIVLLGTPPELAAAGMHVEGRDSLLKSSLINLDKRLKSSGSYEIEAEVEDEQELKAAERFSCRFVEINPKAIRPPCTVSITFNDQTDNHEDFGFDVIERNVAQFKIGLAATVIRKLKYSFEDNYFIAKDDEDDPDQVKENLFFMLDLHLPRNIDEFHPHFYDPWKNFTQRLGLFLGLKLSSDPFKAIFIGVSFALSKDINLVGGIFFHEEIRPSTVEVKWYDWDYAMKLLNREYGAKVFWGLSFSPSLIPRLLGITL